MPEDPTRQYVAECFWPGVDESAVRALDERAGRASADVTDSGEPVRYLGSILMREDEVVLCLFDGSRGAVRRAAEDAGIPFERILEATRSPWPITGSD
jgi:uncharacterized SAM-binding protein YcdF (DUF218 family)